MGFHHAAAAGNNGFDLALERLDLFLDDNDAVELACR
jgi:hypothetical protein